MKLKVLPLPINMDADKVYWQSCVDESKRIKPRLNRNGWYYDRLTKQSWIEVNGEAWLYSEGDSFQFNLDYHDMMNRLEPRVFDALTILVATNIATEQQQRLWEMEHLKRSIRMACLSHYKV